MDQEYGAAYGLAAPPDRLGQAAEAGDLPADVRATFAALDLDRAAVEAFLAIRRRIAALKAELARIRAGLA